MPSLYRICSSPDLDSPSHSGCCIRNIQNLDLITSLRLSSLVRLIFVSSLELRTLQHADLCFFIAELGFLSVGINSSVFTSFALAVFSQYYLRKFVSPPLQKDDLTTQYSYKNLDSTQHGSANTSWSYSFLPSNDTNLVHSFLLSAALDGGTSVSWPLIFIVQKFDDADKI